MEGKVGAINAMVQSDQKPSPNTSQQQRTGYRSNKHWRQCQNGEGVQASEAVDGTPYVLLAQLPEIPAIQIPTFLVSAKSGASF